MYEFLFICLFFFFLFFWNLCLEKLSFRFLLLNYLMFFTLTPCLYQYVLLCGPKICNKDSCTVFPRI